MKTLVKPSTFGCAIPRVCWFALILVLPILPATTSAAIYMKLGDIKGEVVQKDHPNWSELLSVHLGVQTAPTGGSGGGSASSKPVFSDLSWNQELDLSFPKVFEVATKGTHIPTASVHFTSILDGVDRTYFELLFNDVTVSSLSLNANTGSSPVVSGALGFGKITATYNAFDAKGVKKSSTASYDLTGANGNAALVANLFGLGLSGPQAVAPVPLPGALWLFGASVLALARPLARRATRSK